MTAPVPVDEINPDAVAGMFHTRHWHNTRFVHFLTNQPANKPPNSDLVLVDAAMMAAMAKELCDNSKPLWLWSNDDDRNDGDVVVNEEEDEEDDAMMTAHVVGMTHLSSTSMVSLRDKIVAWTRLVLLTNDGTSAGPWSNTTVRHAWSRALNKQVAQKMGRHEFSTLVTEGAVASFSSFHGR
jgi:hypothetical protein